MRMKEKINMTYTEMQEKLSDNIKATTDPNELIWVTCTLNNAEKELMKSLTYSTSNWESLNLFK